jgi:hypothetical protein
VKAGVCGEDRVIAVAVVEVHRHDAPLTEPLLAGSARALYGVEEVLGETAVDSNEIRTTCLETHDALPVIPKKAGRSDSWP